MACSTLVPTRPPAGCSVGVNTTAGVTLPGLNQSLPIGGRAITVNGDGSQVYKTCCFVLCMTAAAARPIALSGWGYLLVHRGRIGQHITDHLPSAMQSDLSSFDITQLRSLQPECYIFNLTNSTGSSALSLPLQPGVVRDTINALYTNPPDCSASA